MAFEFMSYVYPLLSNALFWTILAAAVIVCGFWFLKARKKKRLNHKIICVIPRGGNRIGMITTRGGYWSKNTFLKGLIEKKGEQEFITKENEIIYGASPEDYMEWDGERALFVTPNPDNPKQLFPLSKFMLDKESKQLLARIAPVEVCEAAVDGFEKTTKEMKGITDQVLALIGVGIVGIVFILAVIFITQYWRHGVDGATSAITTSSNNLVETAKILGQAKNSVNTVGGTAP